MLDVVAIGAGQAGLAAGYHLKQARLKFVILEANEHPAGSWPSYYDSLRLFSPARYSSLPGLAFPGEADHYPTRDEVVAYLTGYAVHFRLPIVTNTRVNTVVKQGDIFHVYTTDGREYAARFVIAATGSFNRPKLPIIPNQHLFKGEIIHSSAYRSPTAYVDKRVVVVGAGNSAVQIAVELAQSANVNLASRSPLRFMRQRFLGRDLHFWLKLSGIDTRSLKQSPSKPKVLDTGVYQSAIRKGQPAARAMFTSFTENGIQWADGQDESVDVVIFATGFQPNLGYLSATGALDAAGEALQQDGMSTTVQGLGYVGLNYMRSFSSATLRGVGRDAAYVVKQARNYLGVRAEAQRGWCCKPKFLFSD